MSFSGVNRGGTVKGEYAISPDRFGRSRSALSFGVGLAEANHVACGDPTERGPTNAAKALAAATKA